MKNNARILKIATIFVIFALFIFFRFYNLNHRIIFDWDQEQFSTQIRDIIKDHKFTLLGPRVTSDKGFFLAPYFTYLLIPFFLLSHLHPMALLYFVVIFNIVFFGANYYILHRLFGFITASLFMLLWAVNYLVVGYDIIPWWPITIPFGVILTWYALYRIDKKDDWKNLILLGCIHGLFINMHFQFIFIILFSYLFIVFKYFKSWVTIARTIVISGLTTMAFFLPLLFFDLRHDFLNFKLLLGFFAAGGTGDQRKYLWSWLDVLGNFFRPFTYFHNTLSAVLFFAIILAITIYLIKDSKKFIKIFYSSFIVIWLFFPIVFTIYKRMPSEYYFTFLLPFILIALIDFLSKIKKLYLLGIVLVIMVFFNFPKMQETLKPSPYGMYLKDTVVKKIKDLGEGKNYNVSLNTTIGRNNGYMYLIDWYGIKQSGNPSDPLAEIHIPPSYTDIRITNDIGIKCKPTFNKACHSDY